MGGEAAVLANLVCHFSGKGKGTGQHLVRTVEAQGSSISYYKVTKGWGLLCP